MSPRSRAMLRHSWQTGSLVGSRCGTHVYPHRATTGRPLMRASRMMASAPRPPPSTMCAHRAGSASSVVLSIGLMSRSVIGDHHGSSRSVSPRLGAVPHGLEALPVVVVVRVLVLAPALGIDDERTP